MPVDIDKAEEFEVEKVPTIGQLLRELESIPPSQDRDPSMGEFTDLHKILVKLLTNIKSDWRETSLSPYIKMLERSSNVIMSESKKYKMELKSKTLEF